MNRCVQCLRCVRYCDEVMDVKALAPASRGTMTEIKAFGAHPLDCESAAAASDLSRGRHHQPAVHVRVPAVDAQTRGYDLPILRRRLPDHGADQGQRIDRSQLVVRGPAATTATSARAGFSLSCHKPSGSPGRNRSSAETASSRQRRGRRHSSYVAEQIARLKVAHGADAFGGLISSRCTNEELFVFQKFMRLVIDEQPR